MVMDIAAEVLVVGTGGAGLRAAIEAHENGVEAVLVSKAPAGFNNATIVSGGGFHAAVGGYTPEEHLEDTVRVGKKLNDPVLVKIFAEEGGKRVIELERFGVDIRKRRGGISVGETPGLMGQGLTQPLVEYAHTQGIRIVENVIITMLLREEGRVVGAVGYHSKKMSPVVFQAKAVVLATGGAGALYKRTDCPLKTTGDGYSLAYHTGAGLRDMEFVQFFPLALAEPGAPPYLLSGPVAEEGRIVNVLGEYIPEKHGVLARPLILKSRDMLSRALMKEILEGGGEEGAVMLDAREVFRRRSPDELFSQRRYDFFKDKLEADKRPFRVAPICHFCMGGIDIDPEGYTGVPGLYAAGEVVGGIHGANRHGGNALTDTIVFGSRAGRAATEYAGSIDFSPVEELAEDEIDRYEEIVTRERGFRAHIIMDRLRELMWSKVGIVRDAESLAAAYQEVYELKAQASQLRAFHGRDMAATLEVPMALDAAEMMIRGAMERRESRGAHYRTDFPEEDPRWVKTIIISKRGDAMALESRPLGNAQ